MTQNKRFNSALEQSGMSMYALAKCSGVPYTTINELHNGKNDINQCAAGTVWRIAASLGVEPSSLLNEIFFLDGIKGKYKGIEYVWSTGEFSQITFEYDGEKVTLGAEALYNIASRYKYYTIIAEWMIKEFIEHHEWEKNAKELLDRRLNR